MTTNSGQATSQDRLDPVLEELLKEMIETLAPALAEALAPALVTALSNMAAPKQTSQESAPSGGSYRQEGA